MEREEILWNLVLFLSAGHETTTSLIGSGVLLFLRHLDRLQEVGDRPELMPGAVEEILRYESPIQRIKRVVARDTELRGVRLRSGDYLHVLVGAVNRDSAKFSEPDRFDPGREPTPHVAFGKGIHFCIGAALARLEGAVALRSIFARFPAMRLDPDREPEWSPTTNPRGLVSLPVRLRPGGAR